MGKKWIRKTNNNKIKIIQYFSINFKKKIAWN